ncbi:MAG: 16S rRNA (guanine(966)-N(2))-methyltransferase RsmD [Candidatus Acetothermia bacterium]
MQVISGEKKGYRIYGPGPEKIRPMRQLVRKALFDILRQVVPDSKFLDLYTGTGSVGLEALSRGASSVTFVDSFSGAIQLVNRNLEKLGYEKKARVYEMNARKAIDKFDRRDRRFDVVFLGPPYNEGLAEGTLSQFVGKEVVRRGGLAAVEVFFKNDLADRYGDLAKIKESTYGQNKLYFYRREMESQQ